MEPHELLERLVPLIPPPRAPPLVPAPSASAWDEDEPSGGEPAWELDPSAPDDDGIG